MKVLVLAGGYDQIALIQELKSRGCEVILADYFQNPPAKSYADRHYPISTLDEASVLELARKEQVDLVTTACTDQALLTASSVSEVLGLPCYIAKEKAMQVTNKYYMKRIFSENGIPSARYVLLEQPEGWYDRVKEKNMPFPLVVKPCDCNSSKGVVRVDDAAALCVAVDNAFALSRSGKVVVEEFIDGEEVSIDAWVNGDEAVVLSVSTTSKIANNKNAFTIYQSKYPVDGIDRIRADIETIADNIAKAFGLKNCPLLIQALVRDDKVYVIEFSARMGGGTKYKLIEYMSGVNIMQVYVNRVLGDESQHVHSDWSKDKIEINYVYAYNGTVTAIVGLESLKKSGDIDDFFVYKSLGSTIEKHTTSSDRVLGFLITAPNNEELMKKREYALDNIDILDGEHSILCKEYFK